QNAFLVVADLAAVLVLQRHLIAGYAHARGAELFLVRTVRKIDVQHLGRTQPFDDLDTGEFLPAVEHLGGKHLGGGQRHPERRERPIASKIAAGFGWPGSSSVAAPAENGKVMELPKPYAKKIFGTERQMSSGLSFSTLRANAASL